MTPDDTISAVCAHLVRMNEQMSETRQYMRRKSLVGGVFGAAGFALGSCSFVSRGLDKVQYFVLCGPGEFVIGMGDTKAEALDTARLVLAGIGPSAVAQVASTFNAAQDAQRALERAARREESERSRASLTARPKVIPKRRRAIFEASGGKCHYCGTALTLDGRWHIEHKMPRALLGGSEQSNLVAACVSCNHKKRDRTDLEFLSK